MLCGKGERPGLAGGPHQRPGGPPPPSEPRIRCRGSGGSCAQPLAKRDFRLFTAGRPRCRAPTIPGGLAKGLGGGSAGPCCTPWMGDTAASRWARLYLRPRGLHPLPACTQAGGGAQQCAPNSLRPSQRICAPRVTCTPPAPHSCHTSTVPPLGGQEGAGFTTRGDSVGDRALEVSFLGDCTPTTPFLGGLDPRDPFLGGSAGTRGGQQGPGG